MQWLGGWVEVGQQAACGLVGSVSGVGGPGEVVKQSDMKWSAPISLDPLGHLHPTARPIHDIPGPDWEAGPPARLGATCCVYL